MNGGVFLLAGLALVLAGCTSTGLERGRTDPGANVTPDATAIVRTMGGGLIGSIASGLSERDRQQALEAEYRALEYMSGGQAVTWRGTGTRISGEVIAATPYRVGSQDCRQYRHLVTIAGQPREARGTACRNSDGSWTPLT